MSNTYVAIMAGGIGSRFWPESRTSKPKQFIDILGVGKTLIQSTYERFTNICPPENIYIVTNEDYRELVEEQLPGIHPDQVIGEPMRRNTAPCIAYVSNIIHKQNPNAAVIVAPSDHLITEETSFIKVIGMAIEHVTKHDDLVTLGIRPTRPDTGYGYIQYIEEEGNNEVVQVKTFTEKPDLALAKTFLESGDFLWNSGIFVWNTRTILGAFKAHQSEMADTFEEIVPALGTPDQQEAANRAYSLVSNISIDYGVMEKAENVKVIPSSFGWSDLGTWASLYERLDHDYLGNAVNGKKVMIYDATNCMVSAPDDKLVILQGLDDFIVIETPDVLLICRKGEEQSIKKMTADVKRKLGDNFL